MRISIAQRLVALAGVGVLGVGVVSTSAVLASASQGRTAERMERAGEALSAEWDADMMHDGLRADVLATIAGRAGTPGVTVDAADTRAKAARMLASFDRAAQSVPGGRVADFTEVRPLVARYTASAVTIAEHPESAAEALPAFLGLFENLEERLGALDGALLKDVAQERAADSASAARTRTWVLGVSVAMIAVLLACVALLARAVLGPVIRMRSALTSLAARDLTASVAVRSEDELGDMSRSFNAAVEGLRETIDETGQSVGRLVDASDDLNRISERLGTSAEETAGEAGSVSSAAGSVSDAAGAMSQATHQMDQAIREIASRAASAATVAIEAVDAVDNTTKTVGRLTTASQEIGGILRTITAIAEQTNLLALNATIEAARAGESGKGFAVVANEVKELAHQTAGATEDITSRITAIQEMTNEATLAIDQISEVIGRINENQAMIAAAVEEQSATTAEMSRSVDDVSSRAHEIAGGAVRIAGVTESTAKGAEDAGGAATQLGELAQRVTTLVAQFRV